MTSGLRLNLNGFKNAKYKMQMKMKLTEKV